MNIRLRLNLANDQLKPVNLDMTMLPKKLKSKGYHTYMIGKWHLGLTSFAYTPIGRGFDQSFGFLGGGEDHYTQKINTGLHAPIDFWNSNKPDTRNGTYDTFIYWQILEQLLETHSTTHKNEPLFLYLPMHNVHEPYQAPTRFVDLYKSKMLCEPRCMLQAMVSATDELIGNLTAKLESLALWSNAVFVFASDNGGDPTVGGNAPLKGGKTTLFEGGVRSATFVYSDLIPDEVRGANLTAMTHITDWYSTFCILAGVSPEDDGSNIFPVDSVDLWPLITGKNVSAPRDLIVLGHDFKLGTTKSTGAIISGPWKLIIGEQPYSDYRGPTYPCAEARKAPNCVPYCLFNLEKDPSEHQNLWNISGGEAHFKKLLELYERERNLYQDLTIDRVGFQAAIDHKYRGYMGPWV